MIYRPVRRQVPVQADRRQLPAESAQVPEVDQVIHRPRRQLTAVVAERQGRDDAKLRGPEYGHGALGRRVDSLHGS